MSAEEDALRAEIKELRKRVESLEQWAGNNSPHSQKKQEMMQNESEPKDQPPVQTMGNHSEKTKTESSAATSTDGLNDSFDFPDL